MGVNKKTSRINQEQIRVLILLDTIEVGGPGKGMIQYLKHRPPTIRPYFANFFYRSQGKNLFNVSIRRHGGELFLIEQRSKLDFRAVGELATFIKQNDIHVIQSHSFKAHVFAMLASRKANVPWIAFVHGWTAETLRVHLYNFIEPWLLKMADRICVVTSAIKGRLQNVGISEDKISVVTNAVEIAEHGKKGWRTNLANGLTILCVGRLSYEKGQDILLKAVCIARSSLEISVVVAGEGPFYDDLKQLAKALGVDESVRFSGYVERIDEFYNCADLLVVPSRSEGVPNVILEAMAFGLPVLATDVGGVATMIDNGRTGWLTKPEPEALAADIVRLAGCSEYFEKIALNAQSEVRDNWCPVNRAARIAMIQRETVANSLR